MNALKALVLVLLIGLFVEGFFGYKTRQAMIETNAIVIEVQGQMKDLADVQFKMLEGRNAEAQKLAQSKLPVCDDKAAGLLVEWRDAVKEADRISHAPLGECTGKKSCDQLSSEKWERENLAGKVAEGKLAALIAYADEIRERNK